MGLFQSQFLTDFEVPEHLFSLMPQLEKSQASGTSVEVPVPVKIQKASDSCAENPVFFMVI
jgi:hypothetical protein